VDADLEFECEAARRCNQIDTLVVQPIISSFRIIMASMYSLGCVAAVPFTPFVVDKFERRFGDIILIIEGILQVRCLSELEPASNDKN
jgi:hypothetical protein